MKLSTQRVIPLVFLMVAILYLIFSFSLEQRRMIGDEKGWDPGSRAMPIGTGFLMLGLSIYLVLKETKSDHGEEKPIDSGPLKLIALTITLTILYILCFRHIGFILSTNFLLFTLIYFNFKNDISKDMIPGFFIGTAASSVFIILLYSLGRYVTRSLFLAGKRSEVEILANRPFITAMTFLVLTGLFLIALSLFAKEIRERHSRNLMNAIFIAAGITELLYLVFKQIFWVSLAKGIVSW